MRSGCSKGPVPNAIAVLQMVCPQEFAQEFGKAWEAAWRVSHAEARRGGEAELGVLKGLSPRDLLKGLSPREF